ncbi:RNA 3'-terminal phosphate cyclase [Candidatus Woesearchaeota archaeon]|nr:RNA 3'-terminal phosphate cyclase [Candidatus Woesearchaeota archaeon]
MIKLDGKYGSGGGALVRTALALSTLTGKPFEVNNIRAGKGDGGGLKAQHLHSIKALQQICNAETNPVELGTKELTFHPGKIKRGIYEIDIGTAGSITLFLQAIILPCLFAPGKVTLKIKGGTCGKWQASVYYLQNVLLPHLQRFVEKIELKVIKKGYYPKGGGEVHLEITPRFKLNEYDSFPAFYEDLNFKTAKIKLTSQGELEQIRGIVNLSAELEEKEVGERIKTTVESLLRNYQVPINVRIEYGETFSIGGEIVLGSIFSKNGKVDFDNPTILGGDALIERNKRSEDVGKEATEILKKEISSHTAVDRNLADQLIQFMSLLPESEIETREISNHTKTNIYVAEHFLDIGFKIDGNKIKVEEK